MSEHAALERDLRALGADPATFPPTPDIAAAVADTVRMRGVRPRRRLLGWTPVAHPALAIALVVVVVLGALAAVEPVRSAVLDVLGLRGARIERREPVIARGGAGRKLDLGTRVGLGEARRRAGFTVVAPTRPGPPDEVWFDVVGSRAPQVAFVWGKPVPGHPGSGLLLAELRAGVKPIIEKAAGPRTTIEPVTIDGEPGSWLGGAPHGFAYIGPSGADADTIRLAGPALLWEHDGLLLRLEGAHSKSEALATARSVRAL